MRVEAKYGRHVDTTPYRRLKTCVAASTTATPINRHARTLRTSISPPRSAPP